MFLKTRIQNLAQSKFARNVALVVAGTAGAQIISMLFSPIITRLYGPEAFGLLGIFISITTILASIVALCYPMAIVLTKDDDDAKNLAWLSFFIALFLSFLFATILLIWGERFITLIGAQKITNFVLIIPIFLIFAATLQIAQQWLIRKKQFEVYSRVAIYQATIVGFAKTGLGMINPLAGGLIIIYTLGNLLYSLFVWLIIGNQFKEHIDVRPSIKKLKELFVEFSDFPLYRSPQIFINVISQNLPILLLSSFFGPTFAGFYALAKSVTEQPIYMLSNSLFNVYYPHASEAYNRNENLIPLLRKSTISLAIIGFFPFALLIAFGPQLFGFVFGTEWSSAGEYARWLSIMLFFGFINRPSVATITIIKQQKMLLFYEIFSTATKILALYLGFSIFKSDLIAVALFGLFGALAYIILIAGAFILTKKVSYAPKTSTKKPL